MLKTFQYGVLLSAFSLAGLAYAQDNDVDALLAAHTKAMGGQEAIESVQHFLRIGDMNVTAAGASSLTGQFKSMVVPREKSYRDMSMGMFSSTAGWDGEVGWEKSRMGIRELAGEELERVKREARPFFTTGLWLDPSIKVESLGEQSVDGETYHALHYSAPEWDGFTAYFDPDTMLIERITATTTLPGATEPTEVVTELGDYQAVDGVMFANWVKVEIIGVFSSEIKFTRTIVNGPTYDSIFSKPEPQPF